MHQLFITLIFIERNNRDSIVKLVAERVDSIVNYNQIFQLPVCYDSEIFDIDPFFCPDAMITIETVLNE